MSTLWLFLSIIATKWWGLVAALLFGGIPEAIEHISPRFKAWVDGKMSPHLRRSIALTIMAATFVYASFSAFQDEHNARLAAEERASRYEADLARAQGKISALSVDRSLPVSKMAPTTITLARPQPPAIDSADIPELEVETYPPNHPIYRNVLQSQFLTEPIKFTPPWHVDKVWIDGAQIAQSHEYNPDNPGTLTFAHSLNNIGTIHTPGAVRSGLINIMYFWIKVDSIKNFLHRKPPLNIVMHSDDGRVIKRKIILQLLNDKEMLKLDDPNLS